MAIIDFKLHFSAVCYIILHNVKLLLQSLFEICDIILGVIKLHTVTKIMQDSNAFQTANPLLLTRFSCLHGYQYAGAECGPKLITSPLRKSVRKNVKTVSVNVVCVYGCLDEKGEWKKCPYLMGLNQKTFAHLFSGIEGRIMHNANNQIQLTI